MVTALLIEKLHVGTFLCKKIDSVYDEAFYSRRNVMNQLTFDFIPFQSMKLLSCTIVLTSISNLINTCIAKALSTLLKLFTILHLSWGE